MKSWLLILALFAAAPLHADAIDDYVNQEIVRQRTPGAALAIMQHGVLQRAQGYGFANLELRVPVHADTIFQSGSIGKQFTATAVMLLVEDGKLGLDESIRTYLPQAPRSWQPIRLRHLLTHTSGLPGDPGFDLRRDYDDAQMLKVLYGLKLEFQPGERWSYSNAGYALLGLLIKRVGGEFYGDVLAKRVFAPLHMQTARIISERELVMNRAAGYALSDTTTFNQEWVSPTLNTTADGSLYLSVLDYAKWDAGLLAGKILKAESWQQIYKPVVLNSGKPFHYGFGWGLETFADQPLHQHGGSWQGFQTFFIRFLTDELSVVVLTNSDHGDPERIARQVAALFDAKFALPAGAPIEDHDLAMSARIKSVLEQLARGTLEPGEFTGISAADLSRLADYYSPRVKAAGPLTELRLFALAESGDGHDYRYRGRYEHGVLEIVASVDPHGKFSDFQVSNEPAWDAPLQP